MQSKYKTSVVSCKAEFPNFRQGLLLRILASTASLYIDNAFYPLLEEPKGSNILNSAPGQHPLSAIWQGIAVVM